MNKFQIWWLLAKGDLLEKWYAWRWPTERHALKQISRAHARLRELGWSAAQHCPKDGREFAAIEFGSTGIHRCVYDGEWPNGSYNIISCGDVWPSRPVLYHTDTSLIPAEDPRAVAAWQQTLENMAQPSGHPDDEPPTNNQMER